MTDRPRYPKSSCCVPGCRRTSTLFNCDWLCRDHWMAVDPALRRLRAHMVRRWKRTRAWGNPAKYAMIMRCLDAWWRRVKTQAIERAMGIG